MGRTRKLEVERKFDVDGSYVLPDLPDLPGVASTGTPEERLLDAVYYDTPDLRLGRASVTLQRRTGGTDAGWHLKIPAAAGARHEVHHPLGRAAKTAPKPVVQPVAGLARQAAVGPIAQLRTRRIATPLLDADGRVLAEITDDHVTATVPAPTPGASAVVSSWREVEVELADGDEALLELVGAALVAAGARPSPSMSTIGRVLGARIAELDGAARNGRPAAGATAPADGKRRTGTQLVAPTPSAGEIVVQALRDQLAALQQADVMVRTDAPDGVHRMRVTCRRLRSILAAYRPVLVREHTDRIRDELRWLGAELSAARDAEVSLTHLRKLVGAQPPELVLGPVAARLQQADVKAGAAGREQVLRTLGEPRYFRLLDTLVDLVTSPPLDDLAAGPATPVSGRAITKAAKRLRRRVRTATTTEDPQALAHEVRKAGKRLRYTAEVAKPVLGKRAATVVRAMKNLQKVLGDRQDTVVSREQCRQCGLQAFAAGENAWTYGRLHALEESRAARAEQQFQDLWPTLNRKLRRVTRAL